MAEGGFRRKLGRIMFSKTTPGLWLLMDFHHFYVLYVLWPVALMSFYLLYITWMTRLADRADLPDLIGLLLPIPAFILPYITLTFFGRWLLMKLDADYGKRAVGEDLRKAIEVNAEPWELRTGIKPVDRWVDQLDSWIATVLLLAFLLFALAGAVVVGLPLLVIFTIMLILAIEKANPYVPWIDLFPALLASVLLVYAFVAVAFRAAKRRRLARKVGCRPRDIAFGPPAATSD